MKVSIVIPVFNEEKTVGVSIRRVLDATLQPELEREVVIVDDGSIDDTFKQLQQFESKQVRIVRHEKNQGKGAALRTGFANVSGDIVLVQDADLEYHPKEYVNLLQPILEDHADVVYGSRFISTGPHRVLYYWHYIANRTLTLVSNMCTNLNLTDMETGYKVFKRAIIEQISIKENRFGFEPEITAKIAKIRGVRVYEVGISYFGRTYEEGKKIGWRDGARALWCILKYSVKN